MEKQKSIFKISSSDYVRLFTDYISPTLFFFCFFYFFDKAILHEKPLLNMNRRKCGVHFCRVNFPYTACILMNFPKRIIANFRARCYASAYSLRKNYNDAVGNNSSFLPPPSSSAPPLLRAFPLGESANTTLLQTAD